MKKFIPLLLAAALLSGCSGANGALAAPKYTSAPTYGDHEAAALVRKENPLSDGFAEAVESFSLYTASELLSGAANGLYCPISLYYALSLAAYGASGGTLGQLSAALGVSDRGELARQCGNLYRRLYSDNSVGRLKLAASLWVSGGEALERDYLASAAGDFYAAVYDADFSSDAAGRISDWIGKNTGGALRPELEFDPDTLAAIVSAVDFRGQWLDRFDAAKTEQGVFHAARGDTECSYMNSVYASHAFSRGENYTRSVLALKNGSMVFVLPDEGVAPEALLSSAEALREALFGGEAGCGRVTFRLPKFSFSDRFDAVPALKALGVTDAFTAGADFSAMTGLDTFISGITQSCRISVDEKGVSAASFTAINYAGAAMPEGSADMILDRPFLFAVLSQDGFPLFIGVCADPSAE